MCLYLFVVLCFLFIHSIYSFGSLNMFILLSLSNNSFIWSLYGSAISAFIFLPYVFCEFWPEACIFWWDFSEVWITVRSFREDCASFYQLPEKMTSLGLFLNNSFINNYQLDVLWTVWFQTLIKQHVLPQAIFLRDGDLFLAQPCRKCATF